MDFTFRFSPESSRSQDAWANFFLSSAGEDIETIGSIALLNSQNCVGDTFCSKDVFGTVIFSNTDETAYTDNGTTETLGSMASAGFGTDPGYSSDSAGCSSASFSDSGSSSCGFA